MTTTAPSKLAFLHQKVTSLQPGQRIDVDAHFCRDMEDHVMEGIMGSAYEYGYTRLPERDIVRFWRLKKPLKTESGLRTYVSPDRRHFYDFDGRFYRRNTTNP